MERCRFCQGIVDSATHRCQQCGRLQPAPTVGAPLGQAAQMMRCPACGATMPVGARFCGDCGHGLATKPVDVANSMPGPAPRTPERERFQRDFALSPIAPPAPSDTPAPAEHFSHIPEPDASLSAAPGPAFEEGEERARLEYLNFDMTIGPAHNGEYPVAVQSLAGGEARGAMRLPFDVAALQTQLETLQQAVLPARGTSRQALAEGTQAIQQFGQALFDALFAGDIRSCYDVSLHEALEQQKGLRIRLHIEAPDLAVAPWEYLYDARQGDYLGLSRYTPVVRYLNLPHPVQMLKAHLPLRILVLLVSPTDQDPLDLAGEQCRLHAALDDLEAAGLVQVSWMLQQSRDDLQRTMRAGPWHILHFVGHGGVDASSGEGMIALADQQGRTQLLPAMHLAHLLRDQKALRLVVWNACEGAKGDRKNLFSSTASALARSGIPAILAMQYAISDTAAIELTRVFYLALAEGMGVDAALAEARKAISFGKTSALEWGTPMLYLRAPDGALFDLQQHPPDHWLKVGDRLLKEQHVEAALFAYERAVKLGATSAFAYQRKADALKQLKRPEEALRAYDQALRQDAYLPGAYRGKAEVLRSLGRTKEAAAMELQWGRAQLLQQRRLVYHVSKFWARGLTGLASFLELSIVSILLGFSPLPTSSPLLEVIRLHPAASLLIGGVVVAATVAALLFSHGPEPKGELPQHDRQITRRLLVSNTLATTSTTLFVLLLGVVLIRPPWCPAALCPVTPPLPGVHDANLDLYFTTVQSTYHVIPDDPAKYSLKNLPRSSNALLLGEQQPPPYRVVLGIHSLQQGRFGVLIQEVDLVVDQVGPVSSPLKVWAEQQRNYSTNVFAVTYSTQEPGASIAATYVTFPDGNVQLVPGETDELDLQVTSKVAVDLHFQVQVTYRVTNESESHTLTLPNVFELIISEANNWHLYQLQGGTFTPAP